MNTRSTSNTRALVAVAFLLGACESNPAAGERPASAAYGPPTAADELERDVAVYVTESREVVGRLRLKLELETHTSSPLEIAWSVEWLDRNGDPLALTVTTWHRARLEPGKRLPVEVTAPASGATSWRLHVVPPDSIPLVRDASTDTSRGSR